MERWTRKTAVPGKTLSQCQFFKTQISYALAWDRKGLARREAAD
jgi:hypothetical protein